MIAALVLAVATLAPPAQDTPVEPLYVNLAAPVRVPGVTLAPGEYVFAAGRPLAGQLVLDIYRAGAMSLAASALMVESPLPRPDRGTLLEYGGLEPPFLRAWFHPVFRHGFEFVYPPDEAAAIHAASAAAVPSAVFRGSRALAGLLPSDHIDATYRGGRPSAAAGAAAPAAPGDGPIDNLTLARLEILAHLPEMPPSAATRLTLLNHQLADLTASYWLGRDDVVWRLSLVTATLGNSDFPGDPGAAHVVERVRLRVDRFVAFFR